MRWLKEHPPYFRRPICEHWSARSQRFGLDWYPRGRGLVGAVVCCVTTGPFAFIWWELYVRGANPKIGGPCETTPGSGLATTKSISKYHLFGKSKGELRRQRRVSMFSSSKESVYIFCTPPKFTSLLISRRKRITFCYQLHPPGEGAYTVG